MTWRLEGVSRRRMANHPGPQRLNARPHEPTQVGFAAARPSSHGATARHRAAWQSPTKLYDPAVSLLYHLFLGSAPPLWQTIRMKRHTGRDRAAGCSAGPHAADALP
jgi:hypothetical protein